MKAQTGVRWATLAVWAAVSASAALWGLRLFAPGMPVPPNAGMVAGSQAARGDPLRLLGRAEAPVAAVVPAAPSRFQLLGVMAPGERAAREGVALIAIDGRPARAYRVGAVVDGDLVLQRVRSRGVDLGARGASAPSMALDAPPLPSPATGGFPVTRPPPRAMPVIAPRPLPPQGMPLPEVAPGDEGEPDDAPGDGTLSPPQGAPTQ